MLSELSFFVPGIWFLSISYSELESIGHLVNLKTDREILFEIMFFYQEPNFVVFIEQNAWKFIKQNK